jgi:hypothetical protein
VGQVRSDVPTEPGRVVPVRMDGRVEPLHLVQRVPAASAFHRYPASPGDLARANNFWNAAWSGASIPSSTCDPRANWFSVRILPLPRRPHPG